MVTTYINKIMHNLICVTDVYSSDIIKMFFISQVSGFVKNFNTVIYSDTINVITVTLCIMVLLSELYLFISLSSDLDHISRSQQCQSVLTEKLFSYSVKLKLCRIVK